MPHEFPTEIIRGHIAEAEKSLTAAIKHLRDTEFSETAEMLEGDLRRLRVWTNNGGLLTHLDKEPIDAA